MKVAACFAFLMSSALAVTIDVNPLSTEFINHINNKQSTWTAGQNFDEKTPRSEIKKLLGARKTNAHLKYKPTVHSTEIDIPETFDARTHWPKCADVIGSIADQSSCGSCWAVSVSSAMSDRRCIASDGKLKVPVSADDLLSCCTACGEGCNGGYPDVAWNYWVNNGIVTGGLYNSSSGCKPYPFQTCEHHSTGSHISCDKLSYDTPRCQKQCSTRGLDYNQEKTYGSGSNWILPFEENIQREIFLNGPVSADFSVYSDFLSYKSGVYQQTAGSYEGGHAVRVIGWGKENGVPYWLIANSWNEDWGQKGLFKIIRGKDECGIEGEIFGGTPKL